MPYIEVWVDPGDCGPCLECEKREREDEQQQSDLAYLVSEWIRSKDMGDFRYFDEVIFKVAPKEYDMAVYGPRLVGPQAPKRT